MSNENMSMLNFTETNPSLTKLVQFRSSNTWENLSVKHLPEAEATNFLTILEKLNPEAFAAIDNKQEIQICSLQYIDRSFNKSYPLSLQSHPESPTGLALKLGTEIFHISTFSDLDVEIESIKLAAYTNPTFAITMETNEEIESGYEPNFVILPLPLWLTPETFESFVEDELLGLKKLQMLVKKSKFQELAKCLTEVKIGAVTGDSKPLVAIAELPENTEFHVLATKKVTTKFGLSFVLTIERDGEEINVWMPNDIKKLFKLGAQTSANSTFSYSSYVNRKYNRTCIKSEITNLVAGNEENSDSSNLVF